ncbi:MAG TPA: 4-alpha-glucanotransferase [Burkholderiales bacterium]|nr:4-alpha-glucanotransferase [Burkholderiales bacterium]
MPERDDLDALCAAHGIVRGYEDVWGRRHEASEAALRGLLAELAAGGEPPAAPPGPLEPAPPRTWRPPAIENGGRVWGIAAQLYALRSERNWGIGDFADLGPLLEWCAASGAAALGLSPLHALFAHDPARASPYSPCSRRFLNALYIAPDAVPEAAAAEAFAQLISSPRFAEEIGKARQSKLIDYPAVAALKFRALEALYADFRARHLARGTDRATAFREFQAREGEALRLHALYEALQAHFHGADPAAWGWPAWPAAFRDPRGEAAQRFGRERLERVEYYEYLQWLAAQQLAAAGAHSARLGLGVGLYLDLAVGADRGGSDVWSGQGLYAARASIGAPPDDFNLRGQDWGLPPLRPGALRAARHEPFAQALRAAMAQAGALRIDHVMGLMRLWWIAPGAEPRDGAYVRYPLEELLDVVARESHRGRCLVVGEDLGTVPGEVREALARRGVLSMRLPWFERDAAGELRPPRDFPPDALVTASTHDLPTVAGWWQGHDLRLRRALGLFPDDGAFEAQLAERARDRARLLRALAREGRAVSRPEALADALHEQVAAAPCAIALLQLEDLLGLVEQANLPGTVEQHPNWRRRLPADWLRRLQSEPLRRLAARIGALRRGAPR